MPLRASFQRKPGFGYWSGRNQRRRQVLSVNMISLPLADFRHITHIGNDAHADSFGDLSFLKQGYSLLLQSSQSEQNIFLACSPPPKPPRLNLDDPPHTDHHGWPGNLHNSATQRRNKCNSMPLLDSEEDDQGCQGGSSGPRGASSGPGVVASLGPRGASSGPGVVASPSPCGGNLSSERDGDSTLTCPEDDSCFSFTLDLGPSILDDVLRVMEKLHH